METMDLDLPTPQQFTAGQELATFLASSGILHQAWKEIISTYNVDTCLVNEHEDVVYVTFPSHYKEDFMVGDGRYGECNIQNENRLFSDSLKGDDGMPAIVHKGAFNRFLQESSNFEAKMERFLKDKKERVIIVVGHSMGGGVAILATLWLLVKRVRHISPLCITFGSPLVGDVRFGEAIGREGWSGKFCHVVSKYDIVPRMLFAPFESMAQPLNAIVPHWQSLMGIDSAAVSHLPIQEACRTLLNNVLPYTSTIANNYAGESGLRSPYRPFGTYMFCSIYGASCIEDSEAVSKMLHFTMQSTEENETANACFSEHTSYGDMLKHITEYLLNTTRTPNCVSGDSFEMGIALEVEAVGVGTQNDNALAALKEARNLKNKHAMEIEELNDKLSSSQSHLAEVEWYKWYCKDNGLGYYDAFKQRSDKKDFHVDLARINLRSFWDDIHEKVTNHVLPSDFRSQNKWINAGTAYRRLVEPLDIAEYYHAHRDNGSYLSNGVRPLRHIVLEKWLKEKDQTRIGRDKKARTKFASLTEDSCFWAHLEEASKALKDLGQQQEQHQSMNGQLKNSLEKFEDYVWNMIKDKSISVEVFLEGNGFMIWWQEYKHLQLESPGWQANSLLFTFMENKN